MRRAGHAPERPFVRYWEVSMNAFFKTSGRSRPSRPQPSWQEPRRRPRASAMSSSDHAPDSDSWWNTIKNGLALAGEQMNVEGRGIANPPTGDLADMARIIEQAAALRPRRPIHHHACGPRSFCPGRSRRRSMPASTWFIHQLPARPIQPREVGRPDVCGPARIRRGASPSGQARGAGDGIESFLCVNHYISSPSLDRTLPGLSPTVSGSIWATR